MKIKRASLLLLAVLLLPAMAWAQEGTRNTFLTAKYYVDGNPNPVDATISCNTGLPISQTKSIGPLNEGIDYVDFVEVDFDSGEMDCEITEDVPAGYGVIYAYGQTTLPLPVNQEQAEQLAGNNNDVSLSEDGCFFEDVPDESEQQETENFCLIINYPLPVEVNIDKEWVISNEGSNLNGVDTSYRIDLRCTGPIESVSGSGNINNYGPDSGHAWWTADSDADATYTATVTPNDYLSDTCNVQETVYDSAVETSNSCGYGVNFDVDVNGGPYGCTITNTVFFEGIPTLNQYGLALLALVMLGVGFVGFRRLV